MVQQSKPSTTHGGEVTGYMDNKPKDIFKDDKELLEYTDYWKEKLFLNNWIISVGMADREEFSNPNCVGENHFDIINKACSILILKPEQYGNDRVMKYCAEKILVHELLHCKYNWMKEDNTYEGVYIDTMEAWIVGRNGKKPDYGKV